jgi:phosphoglycerol transferase
LTPASYHRSVMTGARGRSRLDRRGAVAWTVALVGTVIILAVLLELWRADLRIPLQYLQRGDLLWVDALTKGIIENGWYLSNPSLGMPVGLQLYDFPMADGAHVTALKLLSLLSHDHGVVLNAYFLLGFPLTTATALWAMRDLGISYGPSIVASVLYAFLPCHFLRGEVHLFLASYYAVPLIVMMMLRIAVPASHGWRWPVGIAVGLLVASSGIYYAFFACALLIVAGGAAAVEQRRSSPLVVAGMLVAIVAAGVLANVAPSVLYHLRHGANPHVAQRVAGDAEVYGLKITQLLLPQQQHRLPSFRALKATYDVSAPLVNENDAASLGIVGSSGFLWLLGLVLVNGGLRTDAREKVLARLNLAALLLGTIGGGGSLFAFLVTPGLRAYNRISVYIAFFSLAEAAILLDRVCLRWLTVRRATALPYACLGGLLVLGVLDQTPSTVIPPYEELAATYRTEDEFVRRAEDVLPAGAMVFQLPYVPFPESPPTVKMSDYDPFVPYLHSRLLRWSYGAMRGRSGDAWQARREGKKGSDLVDSLAVAGFDGVYVDRNGYADRGRATEADLEATLGARPLVSADGRRALFDLSAYRQHLEARSPADGRARRVDAPTHAVAVEWREGFYDEERSATSVWHWCSGRCSLALTNPSSREQVVRLRLRFATASASRLLIAGDLLRDSVEVPALYEREIRLPPGVHRLELRSDARPVSAVGDPRSLVLQVSDPHFDALDDS